MKDVIEKIPGSFRKMMAKEVSKRLDSPMEAYFITGKDDDDGEDVRRIQSENSELTSTCTTTTQWREEKFQGPCKLQGIFALFSDMISHMVTRCCLVRGEQ